MGCMDGISLFLSHTNHIHQTNARSFPQYIVSNVIHMSCLAALTISKSHPSPLICICLIHASYTSPTTMKKKKKNFLSPLPFLLPICSLRRALRLVQNFVQRVDRQLDHALDVRRHQERQRAHCPQHIPDRLAKNLEQPKTVLERAHTPDQIVQRSCQTLKHIDDQVDQGRVNACHLGHLARKGLNHPQQLVDARGRHRDVATTL